MMMMLLITLMVVTMTIPITMTMMMVTTMDVLMIKNQCTGQKLLSVGCSSSGPSPPFDCLALVHPEVSFEQLNLTVCGWQEWLDAGV